MKYEIKDDNLEYTITITGYTKDSYVACPICGAVFHGSPGIYTDLFDAHDFLMQQLGEHMGGNRNVCIANQALRAGEYYIGKDKRIWSSFVSEEDDEAEMTIEVVSPDELIEDIRVYTNSIKASEKIIADRKAMLALL